MKHAYKLHDKAIGFSVTDGWVKGRISRVVEETPWREKFYYINCKEIPPGHIYPSIPHACLYVIRFHIKACRQSLKSILRLTWRKL